MAANQLMLNTQYVAMGHMDAQGVNHLLQATRGPALPLLGDQGNKGNYCMHGILSIQTRTFICLMLGARAWGQPP